MNAHPQTFKIGLITLGMIIFSCSFILGQKKWDLLYENSAQGKTVMGNLEDLITAVRNGEPIRIYWSFQHPKDSIIKVEHTADAKFCTIMSDRIVLAQIDPIIGQIPDFEAQQITLKENLAWSAIFSSNGKSDMMTRNMITGEIVDHQIRAYSVKWFIKR